MYDSKYNDAHNLVFKVTDRATSYDWMASSSEATGCDYLVQVRAFTIECGEAAYDCVSSKCVLSTDGTGVPLSTCESICKA
jgi:hypothetical protein